MGLINLILKKLQFGVLVQMIMNIRISEKLCFSERTPPERSDNSPEQRAASSVASSSLALLALMAIAALLAAV